MKNTDDVLAQAMLWPDLFGPNQEAFVTLSDVHINFNEMQLTLKAQDPSTSCHSIAVLYAPSSGTVQVWVCDNDSRADAVLRLLRATRHAHYTSLGISALARALDAHVQNRRRESAPAAATA